MNDLARTQLLNLKGEAAFDSIGSGNLADHQHQTPVRILPKETIIDNKFKILSLLGEGGMGAVFKADHLMLHKTVALKTFRSPNLTAESWKRFQREAKAIASLSHKNIVQVFDFGVGENNVPYYTMEYLKGESLAQRLDRVGPLPLDQTMHLFIQVCQALSVAHHKGIIHRDIKPANIFLVSQGSSEETMDEIKLVDFGVAALASQSMEDQKLTSDGTIFGSPLYMSPEQSLGQAVNVHSDIYSVGCSLFETLTGTPPFRGETAFATMLLHQGAPVPRLDDLAPGQEFSQRLNALIAKMLAKQPQERIQSMAEVSAELDEIAKRYDSADRGKRPHSDKASESDRSAGSDQVTDPFIDMPRARRKFLPVVAVILIIAAGVSGIFWSQLKKNTRPAQSGTKAAETATTVPTSTEKKRAVDAVQPYDKTLFSGLDVLQQAPPTAPLGAVARYRQNPQDNRSIARRFFFPGNLSFGYLRWEGQSASKKSIEVVGQQEARGAVIVPPGRYIRLSAGPALNNNPAAFKGFGADDLRSLEFNGSFEWSDKHLAYLDRLTGLETLSLEDINVTDNRIQDIEKLPNLIFLSVDRSAITDSGLSRLKSLLQLQYINASGIRPISKTLEKLTNSHHLDTLAVNDCGLSDSDIKLISSIPSLGRLEVSQNNITENGLAEICKLTKLRTLVIHGTKISPASFKDLQRLSALTSIDIGTVSPAEQVILQKALPRCKVIFEAKRRPITGTLINNEH